MISLCIQATRLVSDKKEASSRPGAGPYALCAFEWRW